MKNVPENELFSAYLDGELTADEQAQVEQLLAESAEARQLLDEFRALSATIQSLPASGVPEDITQRVLRQAERRVLSEPAPREEPAEREKPAAAAAVGASHSGPESGPRPGSFVRRVLRPRNLAWSGVAVAVALMLVVMERTNDTQSRANREVALDTEAASGQSAAPSMHAAPEPTADAAPAESAPANWAVGEGMAADEVADVSVGRTSAPSAEREMAVPSPAAPAEMAAESEEAAPAPEVLAEEAPMTEMPAAPGPTPAPEALAADGHRTSPGPSPVPSRPAEPEPESVAEAAPADVPAPSTEPPGVPGARSEVQPGPALVVRCRVTADAYERGVLQQVLAEKLKAKSIVDQLRFEPKGGLAYRDEDRAKKPESFSREAGKGDVRVFDVEATPAEVQAMIEEMRSRPQAFPSVSDLSVSEPGPGRGRAVTGAFGGRAEVPLGGEGEEAPEEEAAANATEPPGDEGAGFRVLRDSQQNAFGPAGPGKPLRAGAGLHAAGAGAGGGAGAVPMEQPPTLPGEAAAQGQSVRRSDGPKAAELGEKAAPGDAEGMARERRVPPRTYQVRLVVQVIGPDPSVTARIKAEGPPAAAMEAAEPPAAEPAGEDASAAPAAEATK